MNILIDMQGIQTPFSSTRGVGSYIEGMVRELHGIAADHRITYLFNAEFPEAYFRCLDRLRGIVTRENSELFAQRILPEYYSADAATIRVAESFVAAFVETLRPDIFFSPNLQEGLHDRAVTCFAAESARFAQIATLHDMVPMYMEEQYLSDPATRRWHSRKIADAAKCDRLVTVSEASKRDIERFTGLDSAQIVGIPNGFDADHYNVRSAPGEVGSVRKFLKFDGDFILYFGGADKHKNIGRLVNAYASLPRELRERYSLVLGGGDITRANDVLQAINERGLDSQVILPGYVPSSLLPALIRKASLFVFPSIHEGFGLPVVEAIACGAPTLGSDTPAIREILQNPAAIFDPLDVGAIERKIRDTLVSEESRAQLRDRGLERASTFSWRRSASELLSVMEEENERRQNRGRLFHLARRLGSSLADTSAELVRKTAEAIAESAAEASQRTIYLDVSSVAYYGGNSGIQRVVRQVARYLPDAAERFGAAVQVIYAEEGGTRFRALASFAEDETFAPNPHADRLIDFVPFDKLVFLDLHPSLAIRSEREIQRLRAFGISVYHIVYDILPVLMPEKFWPELQEEFYRWLQCVSRSDGLLCISRTVAEQTAEYLSDFGVERSDSLLVSDFKLGSDFSSAGRSDALPAEKDDFPELRGNELTFLMVGTLEPRKAHEQVLLAFERAWAEGRRWRLVIVGREGWKMERLGARIRQHQEFGMRLFWYERATDESLRVIYDLADCVICASEGEGFGLPLIEAARLRKPVLARDIPVFREVGGEWASYFPNSRDAETLKGSILDWVNHRTPEARSRSGAFQALTWKQAADSLATALHSPTWPFSIRPLGALDLRNPISIDSPNLQKKGFYQPEGAFAWLAPSASLEFHTVLPYETVELELECFSWRRMPFEMLLDGKPVHTAVAGMTPAVHKISLAGLAAGLHKIEFRSQRGGSPPNDNRALGIAIKHLRMVAISPIKLDQWVNVRDLNVAWTNFSAVEFDWRWTIGSRARIEFSVAELPDHGEISIFCRAARQSTASFLLNGVSMGKQDLPIDAQVIQVPANSLRQGSNSLEIVFESVGPFSQDDRRELGLTVLEFKVAAVGVLPQQAQQDPAKLMPETPLRQVGQI